MKAILLGFVLSATLACSVSTQGQATPTSLERDASPGGAIRMKLSAGGYTIRASRDNKIRVRWDAASDEDLASDRVKVEVHGTEATIRTHGPSNNFRVQIEIPAHSDLYARLTAGQLTIEGIEGSKDVESHAGDVEIEVGNPGWYSFVDGSVYFGDLDASAFHISKGGIGRSFTWHGGGNYRLHAHVGAGDLRLY